MTEQISSLMDGELEAHEAERAIRTCCAAENQKATWFLYHAIGDAMRGHAPQDLARPTRVFDALHTQPTVLAPKPRVGAGAFARVAIAAAASVATVAVVAWIGLQGGAQDRGEAVVAKSAASIQPVANKTTVAAPRASVVDEQAYLTAHRQLPSLELDRPVNNRPATPAR
jgi:sigma-E factor negative regulatory protein RseA